jgi:uncharacterized protein YoxC
METNDIVQIVLGVALTSMGFFLKRVVHQLDQTIRRVRDVEIDVAALAVESRELHDRLERIEDKIDRLLER